MVPNFATAGHPGRPLNPTLYSRLTKAFGPVKIVRAGQHNNVQREADPFKRTRLITRLIAEGETYFVNCPACGDKRQRLSVNHEWSANGSLSYLLHCFNENCQEDPTFRQELEYMLLPFGGARGMIVTPASGPVVMAQPQAVTAPGPCVRLDELLPDHCSHKLLRRRGHDPIKLGQYFGLSYCEHSSMPQADRRIIIPAAKDGQLVGWQARYVDDAGSGDVANLFRCPQCRSNFQGTAMSRICPACAEPGEKLAKYWSAPGFRKSETLLNCDQAKLFNFVVLMEGPMDVFRLGHPRLGQDFPGPGVAMFGHTLSVAQKKLAHTCWRSGHVFVMLDSDAKEAAEAMTTDLRIDFPRVHLIGLPNGCDPDDCPHDYLWGKITATAKNNGARLSGPGFAAL